MLFEREQPLSAAPRPAVGRPVVSSRAAHPCRLITQEQPGKRQSAKNWVALSVATALCVLGFPGTASFAATSGGLQLTVSPTVSAVDAPLTIRVSGLQPGAKVTLTVSSVDAAGVNWTSTDTYSAGSAGTVDPATSENTGPSALKGYNGTDPMGPVDFMSAAQYPSIAPGSGPARPFNLPDGWPAMYSWAECSLSFQGQRGCTWSKPLSFAFTATSGQAHAQAKPVMAELAAARDSYPHELLEYPDAGHGVGTLVPYYPGWASFEHAVAAVGGILMGGNAVANPLARADQWPKLLSFLRN